MALGMWMKDIGTAVPPHMLLQAEPALWHVIVLLFSSYPKKQNLECIFDKSNISMLYCVIGF